MKKRILVVILIALVAVTFAGRPVAKAQDEPFRVAAVAPSATTDLAFSQSMFDALTMLQTEWGEDKFTFTFQEGTFIVDDAAVSLREWAASGDYDLIVAHGSQYGAILEELAPEFPDVSFAWGTDVNTFGLDNVYAYTAASDQGGYINGVVAAMLSDAGNIGVVGPIEVGDAKLYVDGFKYGVSATKPEATVNVNYIQSFSDVPLATAAAETFVSNGADVLTGSAQMVVGPIGVAKEEGLLWFGTQSSQAELAGDAGVLFQIYRWDIVLKDIISKIGEGTLGGESYTLNLENGGLEMELSQYNTTLTDEQKTQITQTVSDLSAKIIAGEISTLPMTTMPVEATAEATATE